MSICIRSGHRKKHHTTPHITTRRRKHLTGTARTTALRAVRYVHRLVHGHALGQRKIDDTTTRTGQAKYYIYTGGAASAVVLGAYIFRSCFECKSCFVRTGERPLQQHHARARVAHTKLTPRDIGNRTMSSARPSSSSSSSGVNKETKRNKPAHVTWCKLQAHPHRERHAAVVDDVQRGHVLRFFAQNEEQRVKELGELGNVVPPAGRRHLRNGGRSGERG